MESALMSRVGKPLLMFAITYFAVRYLTGSSNDGLLVGGIPLVLGATNIFARLGYALAAFSVIGAVFWAVAPESVRSQVIERAEEGSQHVLKPKPSEPTPLPVSNPIRPVAKKPIAPPPQ